MAENLMRVYLLISLTLWLATCGQKGPLYLPEKGYYPEPENSLPAPALQAQPRAAGIAQARQINRAEVC
ncbi:MAG: lipoprotein [Pseudomonadota bacterium]